MSIPSKLIYQSILLPTVYYQSIKNASHLREKQRFYWKRKRAGKTFFNCQKTAKTERNGGSGVTCTVTKIALVSASLTNKSSGRLRVFPSSADVLNAAGAGQHIKQKYGLEAEPLAEDAMRTKTVGQWAQAHGCMLKYI